MKKNIGILNAMIRIMLGLICIGTSTASLVRKPYCMTSMGSLILGAAKVASGITRFCPITYCMVKCEDKWEEMV